MHLNWLLAAIPALLGVLFLVMAKRRSERVAWRAWRAVVGDDDRAIVDWLQMQTDVHLRALAGALRVARDDHEHGHYEDVRHVLQEVDAHAERHIQQGLGRLSRWEDLARPLAALRPLPSLPTRDLSLRPLRRLARLQGLAGVLMTDTARFLLGLRTQRAALHIIGWAFAAALRRAEQDVQLTRALDEMSTGHDDLAVLDAQAVLTLTCLLASLRDEPTAASGKPA